MFPAVAVEELKMRANERTISFALTAVLLAGPAVAADKTTVHLRLMDTAAGKPTPAMVCITGRPAARSDCLPTGQ